MSEIKRGQVPWKRSVPNPSARPEASAVSEAQAKARLAAAKRKERPILDAANAVAFRGNLMTGEALDARKDLPPQGFNPPPKEVRAKRRAQLAKTYAQPTVTRHPSAKDPFTRLRNPETQKTAMMQRLVNTNETVRFAFERAVGAKVIKNGRTDGVFTLAETPPSQIGVATGAMTGGGIAPDSFYGMLAAMDAAVMKQAEELAALQAQKNGGGSSGGAYGSFLGMPYGPGLGMLDAWGGEDASSGLGASLGGLASNVAGETSGPGGSVDVATQKVSLAVQRMNQMYSLIGTMYSKYNESGAQAVNNIK